MDPLGLKSNRQSIFLDLGVDCGSKATTEPQVSKSTHVHTLRVQVPNNHILTPNLFYNYYYPNPKYPNIGYMDC